MAGSWSTKLFPSHATPRRFALSASWPGGIGLLWLGFPTSSSRSIPVGPTQAVVRIGSKPTQHVGGHPVPSVALRRRARTIRPRFALERCHSTAGLQSGESHRPIRRSGVRPSFASARRKLRLTARTEAHGGEQRRMFGGQRVVIGVLQSSLAGLTFSAQIRQL